MNSDIFIQFDNCVSLLRIKRREINITYPHHNLNKSDIYALYIQPISIILNNPDFPLRSRLSTDSPLTVDVLYP